MSLHPACPRYGRRLDGRKLLLGAIAGVVALILLEAERCRNSSRSHWRVLSARSVAGGKRGPTPAGSAPRSWGPSIGTLVVNVLGCLALGLVAGAASTEPPPDGAAVGTGFLGSFTTFSTFSVETVQLAQAGSLGLAGLNLLLQIGLGGLAAFAGLALGRTLAGAA